jgi:SAM-dependent methyltransferase
MEHKVVNQTAEYWGAHYFSESFNRQEWQAHPLSIERQCRLQDGLVREAWFAKKYLPVPARRALGIGAGRAETEIGLLSIGAAEHFDLYDLSPVGLDYAKSCAEQRGFGDKVTCHCMPIEAAAIAPGSYDLVTYVAALHHMQPLEDSLRLANDALTPRGLIWAANEYIGPDRFDYPARDVAIAEAFFQEIPARFRNKWCATLPRPTPEEVAAADPSEAPCSSQIEPVMRRMFPRLEMTPLYGAFAFILFWGLNHDALYETPEGAEFVRFVLAMDKALVDAGSLPNYFAHFVAWKY